MYAVVEASGRQWKVEPGTRLVLNRISTPVGSQHTLDRVLFAHDGTHAKVGRPYVEGAQVICEVVEHGLGPKTISYHFRRRENWRKTVGHRQPLSRLLVKDIVLSGATAPSAAVATVQEGTAPAGRSRTPSARASGRATPAASRGEAKRAGAGEGRAEGRSPRPSAKPTPRTRKGSTHGA